MSPGRGGRTRPVSIAEIRGYMGKAEEFLEAADAEFAAGRLVPATSLAVHATINAGDVAAGLRSGQRAAGQGHDQALTLLEASGSDGRAVARELRRLLPLKNRAEYEHRGISRNDAQRALRAARAAVSVARRVLAERDS